MTPSPWIETVITPELAWAGGGAVEPYTPFELTTPIRVGPPGSGADLVWPAVHELELSPAPGGILARAIPGTAQADLVPAGASWESPPLQLRVLSSPQDSAGWPTGLVRPPGPWSDETLSVLGDQLLERGRTVGRRFIDAAAKADDSWLPAFSGRRRLDGAVSWRRGVVEALTIFAPSTFEFGFGLARQAVCVPVRQLTLEFGRFPDYPAIVRGLIAGGGFPCLEQLRFTLDASPVGRRETAPSLARDLSRVPGFGAAFPLLTTFEPEQELPSPRVYPVVG